MGDDFLDHNGIVTGPSVGHEASLTFPNNAWKQRFESIGNDLGDDFVNGIAETNGSATFQTLDIQSLRNKAMESFVGLKRHEC